VDRTLNDRGDLNKIEEIYDVRTVQLVPLHWGRVAYENKEFLFKEPIQIQVDFQDGIWIHQNETFGILGYGKSRAESLDAFRMEFVACWETIASEDDSKLTDDAKELKKKLKNLVKLAGIK
jgi:hypothetical protein